ncbi:hypothetical protein [Roseiconus lacunae]|uniref:hypothetical protein n=1 Tax=Roseiconus lacunae TaxID=2605694 RepID=UPI001E2BAC11|nr:hypothetical protein [Roseiconus lacunae]MCD0458293.1 hypothetical protein [Roseiconus lacunae]
MRQFKLLRKFSLSALVASSAMVGSPVLAGDFDALLAEIQFENPSTPIAPPLVNAGVPGVETGAQSALGLEMPAQPVSVEAEAVAPSPVATPIQPNATAPTHVAPVAATPAHAHAAPAGDCQSCGNHAACDCQHGCKGCGSCLGNRIHQGACTPYMPPQLPTSTFYQYWRSNACNTNVWDGYQNRCRTTIDLSIHHKHRRGCDACGNVYNSVPANWCDMQESCD